MLELFNHFASWCLGMEAIALPHLSDQPLQICLFKEVKNAAFLRKQLLEGNTEFEYAFLDASALISRNHALAACFRAINDRLNNRLKSRNVHSEIVFSLSPNNNVSRRHVIAAFSYTPNTIPVLPNLTLSRSQNPSAASASRMTRPTSSQSK